MSQKRWFKKKQNIFNATSLKPTNHQALKSKWVNFEVWLTDSHRWLIVCSCAVERCMCSMQTGSHMTKLKGKKKGLLRFFYLDEHKSCVRWRPSRKQDRAKSEWETDDVIKVDCSTDDVIKVDTGGFSEPSRSVSNVVVHKLWPAYHLWYYC